MSVSGDSERNSWREPRLPHDHSRARSRLPTTVDRAGKLASTPVRRVELIVEGVSTAVNVPAPPRRLGSDVPIIPVAKRRCRTENAVDADGIPYILRCVFLAHFTRVKTGATTPFGGPDHRAPGRPGGDGKADSVSFGYRQVTSADRNAGFSDVRFRRLLSGIAVVYLGTKPGPPANGRE
jgi:hypothetical protein